MTLEYFDDIKITYKDGKVEHHSINVSNAEGLKKRDKLIKKGIVNKNVESYELTFNSKTKKSDG